MARLVDKTLLIDDSDIDLFIQRRFLEVYNFSNQLVLYKSANEALDWLKNINGEPAPDIIFLDLNMPVMNGWEFLKEFTRHYYDQFSNTKIVVLSSSIDNMPSLPQYPCIDYITKPITNDILKRLSNELVRNEGVGVC